MSHVTSEPPTVTGVATAVCTAIALVFRIWPPRILKLFERFGVCCWVARYLIRVHFISCFIRPENGIEFCAWTLEHLQHLIWLNTGNKVIRSAQLAESMLTKLPNMNIITLNVGKNNICSCKFIVFENK
jgi:hypothetical protein